MNNYFSESDFKCKCGCGQGEWNPRLKNILNEFREFLNTPVIVTSGYRCPTHNSKVGGAKNSYHVKSMAVDIVVRGYTGPQLYQQLMRFGRDKFGGVGIARTFLHLDLGPTRRFFYDGVHIADVDSI